MPSAVPPSRRLGQAGPIVFPLALGAMGMSKMYGTSDDRESLATIHAALDRGINLIDTGDFYGSGHNEALIGRALSGRRDRAVISVKFGALRDPAGGWTGVDNRPVAIRNYLAYTLQRLGGDHVDIYRPARLDPAVPIEDVAGTVGDLVKQGYVRHFGLSEVGADTILRAHAGIRSPTQISTRSSAGAPRRPSCRRCASSASGSGVQRPSRGLLRGSKPTGPGLHATCPSSAARPGGTSGSSTPSLQSRKGAARLPHSSPSFVAVHGADIVPVISARTTPADKALGIALDLSPAEPPRSSHRPSRR
jgi:pyridoxine 4-dehydrogenase